jgi:2-polyprenyl-6-methoxyphenol hydroxylase-like FAD-dependent oxidoreductase
MDVDVVVAGAGPVGLLLAGELAGAGVRVLVVERGSAEPQPLKEGEMGGRSINAPSASAMFQRGLLEEVRAAAFWWYTPEPPKEGEEPPFTGHFAGIPLRPELIDPADPDLAGSAHGAGVLPIGAFERILATYASSKGAELRYDSPLTGFTQDAEGVTVEAAGRSIRAGWLVGCDGGRSTVRKLAGFEFPGADPVWLSRQVLVDMDNPELLLPGGLHETETGSYILGGWERRLRPTRLMLMESIELAQPPADRDAPVTPEEIQAAVKRITGFDVTVTAIHAASRFGDNTRQASTYRMDRVLIAGDAAHVHSPAGGQGMNTGIGDAMNLGWKLAATINGWAPEGLLDTYTSERHPLGAWVQNWTMAQTALNRKDPHSLALHGIVGDLLNSTPGTMYVLKKISGVANRIDLPGDHPRIGRVVPDLPLPDGTVAGQHVGSGHYLLIGQSRLIGQGRLTGEPAGPYADLADRLRVLPIEAPGALLVRPDGHVALASDEGLAEAEVRAHLS